SFIDSGPTLSVALDGHLYQRLQHLTKGNLFLIFTAFLAAVDVTLHKYTGKNTLVVGTPARLGRLDEPPPVNALISVVDVRDEVDFPALLKQVHTTLVEAYRRQRYPIGRLVHELALEVEGRCPLLDVSLSCEGLHGPLPPEVSPDLSIHLTPRSEHLHVAFHFHTPLPDLGTGQRFANHCRHILEQALSETHKCIGQLTLLSAAEVQHQVYTWNATSTNYPRTTLLHQFFEQQTVLQPEALAVVCEGTQLTYAELDRKANQLARLLRARSVQRGTPVAVWIEPSEHMIVSVLAILKAGGHYVALDATWPAERNRWVLSSVQVQHLVTETPQLSA